LRFAGESAGKFSSTRFSQHPAEEEVVSVAVGLAVRHLDPKVLKVFEAVVEEQIFRELLDDPASRRVLLEEKKQSSLVAFFRSAFVPAGGLALAGAAAALFFYLRTTPVPLTELAMLSPAAEEGLNPAYASKDFDLTLGLDLSVASTTVAVGDELQATIGCSQAAQLVLLERRKGERSRIVYPGMFAKTAMVVAGERISIPGKNRRKVRIAGAPGEVDLILLAFRPDTDLTDALAGKAAFPPAESSRSIAISIVSR
jgi:hypothetical protein